MDAIDITTPEAAMAYLRTISPGWRLGFDAITGAIHPAYDAVRVIVGHSPYVWAITRSIARADMETIIAQLEAEGHR